MPEDEGLELEGQEKQEQKPETVTISKAEFDRMQRETQEARQSERFWADRARGNGNGHAAAPQITEEEEPIETADLLPKPKKVTGAGDVDEAIFNDPDKWLEAIAKGPKAIEALVKKQGYVNAEEVAEIASKVAKRTVDVERGKINTDARLMNAFPDLADNKSELFKATAEEYQELIAFDPSAQKSPATLFAAAKAAKARLAAAAPKRKDDEDYEETYDRVETNRRRRVEAQDGSRAGRAARDEDSDSMGPQAKQIAKMMGITEDEFKAEKKKTDATRRAGRA
jgi:protein-tyrosine-phosphatase